MNFENLKKLLTDENAVSPVIGVILMVAITVILAAVIGTFVLGLGDKVGNNAPQASFSFDYDRSNNNLDITHNGGAKIPEARLSVKVANDAGTANTADTTLSDWSSGSDVTAGDTVTIEGIDGGETVRVVWTSDSGDSSAELASWTGPDA